MADVYTWLTLPDYGPRSQCSTRGCSKDAVAVRTGGRNRRWFCRQHLTRELEKAAR